MYFKHRFLDWILLGSWERKVFPYEEIKVIQHVASSPKPAIQHCHSGEGESLQTPPTELMGQHTNTEVPIQKKGIDKIFQTDVRESMTRRKLVRE